ncbi:MAG: hypothetical protein KC502_11110 [Myxococcales bacterium]|nr:hypothetical protein [Myxococcales bacterium]
MNIAIVFLVTTLAPAQVDAHRKVVNGAQRPANKNAAKARPKAKKKYTLHIDRTTRKRIRYHNLVVPVLKKRFRYMVYLPKDGIKPGRRYPILVLLHGLGEYPHGWITLGKVHELIDPLVKQGKMPQPIVLLASGRNGYWTNWADGRHPYGDLVVSSYLEDMRKRYPITDRADLTAVVGCSMGGFGALSLGLRHPETFGFIAALSPTDIEVAVKLQPRRPVYRKLVGPPPYDRAVRRINPRHLVERGFGSPRQRFLLVYGSREGPKFGEGTRRVADQMRLRGLNVEVLRVEGEGHGWRNAWARSHPWWLKRLASRWRKALLRD